ncbi:MAG TPA: chemotaxis protein MotC [Rhizobiaceae bacterium]|nr:chemotaxis protein MotC [Rhizobiaceae bacterium]
MRRLVLLSATVVAASLGSPVVLRAEVGDELQPYQMVRSLQIVQDKIAAGDHAAIPMQRKLLDMIDARFKDTESEDYNDLRNYRAMLIYAMSGGNPRTIEVALARIHLDETNRSLGIGILNYLRGNHKAAKAVLDGVDPLKLTPELGAFFALVKGSVNSVEQPENAFKMFDQARLLAPGTLVEEAALRRIIMVATSAAAPDRFLYASDQYVRRFLASPYASQFADSFVTGVMDLYKTLDRAMLADVIAKMSPVQQKTIYLRLARRSAIDGDAELAAFASEKAESIEARGFDANGDPRAELYAALASVTSDTVTQSLERLKKIDRTLLSEGDRKLLEAAEAMAAEVTNVPRPETPEPVVRADAKPAAEGEIDEADLMPEGEVAATEPTDLGTERVEAEAAAHEAETEQTAPAAKAEATPEETDPTTLLVTDTRKKLEEIDKLLEETVQ